MDTQTPQENNNLSKKDILRRIKAHPILFVCLCLTLPILILQIIYFILIHFNISVFAEPLSESDLLGFWGSILGSLIGGLFAVYVLHITIQNEREILKEERKLSINPCLLYEIENQKVVYDVTKSIDLFNAGLTNKQCISFDFVISNVGLGPAVFVNINDWKFENTNFMDLIEIQAVPKDSKEVVSLKIKLPSDKDYDKLIGQRKNFSVSITYENLLGNKYYQEVFFEFRRLREYRDDMYSTLLEKFTIIEVSKAKERAKN